MVTFSCKQADSPKNNGKEQDVAGDKSIYYKDVALFRFVDEDAVKVVRDTEFMNEFRRRANDTYWDSIDCIQTCVKAKTGIGQPLFMHFLAPINEHSPDKEIDYKGAMAELGEDQDLLARSEDDTYAYK